MRVFEQGAAFRVSQIDLHNTRAIGIDRRYRKQARGIDRIQLDLIDVQSMNGTRAADQESA